MKILYNVSLSYAKYSFVPLFCWSVSRSFVVIELVFLVNANNIRSRFWLLVSGWLARWAKCWIGFQGWHLVWVTHQQGVKGNAVSAALMSRDEGNTACYAFTRRVRLRWLCMFRCQAKKLNPLGKFYQYCLLSLCILLLWMPKKVYYRTRLACSGVVGL